MIIHKEYWGITPDGQDVQLFTLDNGRGMTAGISNYGGIVTFLKVPSKTGRTDDVVLGFNNLQPYLDGAPYFGAIIGRYANRINRGKFILEGKEFNLAINNGPNHLHGGIKGFDKVVWQAEEVYDSSFVGLNLSYFSPDGEEAYPGNLKVSVLYSLTLNNELKITYETQTDKPTPINLTHHGYFNLKGEGKGDILTHQLMIKADHYTPADDQMIPTGDIKSVRGTPFDFRTMTAIGERIDTVPGGYDLNFVLSALKDDVCALVYEPTTQRHMELKTTEPGLQFYTGNFLDGSFTGKSGCNYQKHSGFCLETQHFPDSPNHAAFPDVILKPGEKYTQTTVYRFF